MVESNEAVAEATAGRVDGAPSDFIREMVAADQRSGKYGGRVVTRFPPEPNGYPHIGHAKSICLNFGLAAEFGGVCHLRFDDTNPTTEEDEYVEALKDGVRWLGFDWGDKLFFASDYFEQLYRFAQQLIRDGKAYVDSLSEQEIREYRGTVLEAGRESPHRGRSVAENLDLFERMRRGEFPEGAHVVRAKIDMAATNMKMRDPLMYRIRHAHHYRTGDAWAVYPMYDFAHCLSDAIERITHSLCTLEFENNRDPYDWFVEQLIEPPRPEQTEFARLKLSNTVLSKRKLIELVQKGHVEGWDDPRMPTLSGLSRRGYTPSSIRTFCRDIGVARANSTVDVAALEHAIRDDLNLEVQRVLCVLRPLKVVIENWPEDRVEELDAPFYPRDVPKEGSRRLPFSRELYIEREDFLEDPPKKFFRLAPGREVRLRYGYIIRCERVVKDPESGEIVELRCTYDPETRGGAAPGRKIQGTIHWVSAAHAVPLEVRLYDRLFTVEDPSADKDVDFKTFLNPASLEILERALGEPMLAQAEPGSRFQFERQGYFYLDPERPSGPLPTFNRIVTLRDAWTRQSAGQLASQSAGEPGAAAAPASSAPAATPRKEKGGGGKGKPASPALTPEQEAVRERYRETLGLSDQDARTLASDADLAAFFESALEAHDNPRGVANWIANELLGLLPDGGIAALPFGGRELGELVALLDGGAIAGPGAKEVLAELVETGGRPAEIVERRGLRQLDDAGELEPLVDEVLASHPDNVALYRGGKSALLGFFVGQVMKASGGRANPRLVQDLVRRRLDGT